MPIRPKPFTLTCAHCRWSRVFHPLSDTLRLGIDIVAECPVCNSVDLERKHLTLTQAIAHVRGAWRNNHPSPCNPKKG